MSGSLHSLTKSLTNAFTNRSKHAESELPSAITAYIDKHTPPSENDRKRLQADLLDLHRQYVSADNSATFLHVLTLLRHDFIIDAEACSTWWSLLLSPVLNHTELLKATLKDSLTICLDVMVPKDDDEEFKTRYAAAERFKSCIYESYFDAIVNDRIKVAENLQYLLIAFARQRTKEYFESIDPFLQDPSRRLHTLTLLSSFVRLQTQYIYQIADTPLLDSLLSSLEHDTSTTVVSLALTILIMIVPHIPNRIGNMLARLFYIFGRVLCWDLLGAVQRRTTALVEVEKSAFEKSSVPSSPRLEAEDREGGWRPLDASFDNSLSTPPDCSQYFTFLYGLYPVNFLSYIRAASEFPQITGIRSSSSEKDDLDDETIRTRAEPFVKRHLVHPNFTCFTIQSEKEDLSRWMKLESSDVVTLCISLDSINIDHDLLPIQSSVPDQDVASLNLESDRKESGEIDVEEVPQEAHIASPLLPNIQEGVSTDQTTANMIDAFFSDSKDNAGSRLASPAFAPKLVTRESRAIAPASRNSSISRKSVISPNDVLRVHEELLFREVNAPLDYESVTSPGSDVDTEAKANMSFYHRELLLLKNELRFERHLRQQHLQHIGRLQRDRISDAALESERQNLYNTTKALKSQVSNLQNVLQKLRNEAHTSKANRTQYEASLNERIKRLREEKTKYQTETESLQAAINLANRDVANMQIALGVAEGQALNLKQQLQVLQPEIQEAKDLRSNLDLLKNRIREAEVQDLQLRMEKERVIEAQAQVKQTMLKYAALQSEFAEHVEATKQLEKSSQQTQIEPRERDGERTALIEKLQGKTASLTQQLANLTQRHSQLQETNASLQSKILDLEATAEADSAAATFRDTLASDRAGSSTRSMRESESKVELSSPMVNAMAVNPKLFETEDSLHGTRRPQPLGLVTKDSIPPRTGRSVSTTTVELAKSADKPSRSSTSSPMTKGVKDNKDRVSLGGRFRW